MNPHYLSCLTLLSCFGLTVSTTAFAQSSLEQLPVTGSDVASELGLVMTKFKARFPEPVYCRVRLEIRAIGGKDMVEIETRSPDPRRTTEILFSIKDVEFMKRQMGLLESAEKNKEEESYIPVSFTIKAETFATRHYALNPFGIPFPGTSFITWSPQHSTEDLPLDEDIPIFIKTGPYLGGREHKVQDILQQYILASAYVRLTVRFSKEPLPTKKEVKAEEKRRAMLEDILAKFDELVEKVQDEQEKENTAPSEPETREDKE